MSKTNSIYKKLSIYIRKNPKNILVGTTAIFLLFILGFVIYKYVSIPRAPDFRPAKGGYLYKARGANFTAFIGNKDSNRPEVNFTVGKGSVVLTPASGSEKLNTPTKEGNQLIFKDIYTNIDYKYQTTPKGIKEEIIINKPSIIKTFPFFMDFNGVSPKFFAQDLAGGVFYDENENYMFHFEEPFAIDAKGNRTENIGIAIKKDPISKKYMAVISADPEWLFSDERVYPIYIDPTIIHDESSEFSAGLFNRTKDTGSGESPNLTTYFQEVYANIHTLGLYHFSEGSCTTDSSGNGFTLTANGGMTCSSGGIFDYKASGFANTPVSYSQTTILDRAMSTGTISAWINPTAISGTQTIIYADAANDTLVTLGSSGQINFSTSGSTNLATSNNAVIAGVWTHIAVTWSPTGHKIYINGMEIVSDTNTTTHTNQNYTTYIGVGAGGNTNSFGGSIDEILISLRDLSPEEIKNIASLMPYSSYTSPVIDLTDNVTSWNSFSWSEAGASTGNSETPANSDSLVAQWNFNEASGTTANNDAGGSSCAGTPSNCNFNLNNFASTGSRDAIPLSGWTADNKRWGAGAIMVSSLPTADMLYVQDPANNALDPNSNDLTIEMWIKTTDSTAELFSNNDLNGTSCTSNGYYLGIDGGYPVFYLDSNGATAGCDVVISSPTTKINDGEWHHLAISVTRGSLALLYLDGEIVGIDTSVSSYSSVTNFGNVWISSTHNFDGIIDSVRFFQRALSQNEIIANSNLSNVEFQTRVGSDSSPDDGGWEEWSPNAGETQVLSLDSDQTNWSWDNTATYMSKNKTDESNIKSEGSGSLKITTGVLQVDANTVSLWHFDETNGDNAGLDLFDETANNNDGEFQGTGIASAVTNGISGKARNFNGTNDYISTSNSYNNPTTFTIEAWFKTTTTTGGTIIAFGNSQTGGSSDYDRQLWMGNTGAIYFGVYPSGEHVINTTSTYNDGKWHYVAAGLSASGMVIRMDGGAEVVTNAGVTSAQNFTGYWKIGYENAEWSTGQPTSFYFNGTIDEMRISNIARSAEEIAENHRLGRGHKISRSINPNDLSDSNLLPFYIASDRLGAHVEAIIGESAFANHEPDANTILFWQLEENYGSGAYIKDASSSENHGTPTGTTFVQGKFGKARSFPGTSTSHYIIKNPVANFPTTAITADFWVKTSSAGNDSIISYASASSDDSFLIGNSSNLVVIVAGNTAPTGVVINDNLWHHLAITWQSSGGILKVYKDGVLAYSGTLSSGESITQNGSFVIGQDQDSVGGGFESEQSFPGIIDNVRISNTIRSADDVRQTYEIMTRSNLVRFDFKAKLDSANLIANSGDTSFTLDATAFGATSKGKGIFPGEKIIVKETVNDTTYIAQGTVTTINVSSGAVTVTSWDEGSTFPTSGYGVNSTLFKWQREYFDLSGSLASHRDAISMITLRLTDGQQGGVIFLDDFKKAGDYMTTAEGSTISSSTGYRYFQYKAIFYSRGKKTSSSLTSTTVNFGFVANTAPGVPDLDSPGDDETGTSLTPDLKTTATDADSDNLQYKIQLCSDSEMSENCQTFDQSSSQTGWSGQNADDSTTYSSGTQATYTLQSSLTPGTTYYWRSYAIDPAGTNTWGNTQESLYSFTTTQAPTSPTLPLTQGAENPSGLVTTTPYFSAIHNDPDGDSANFYQILVNTNSDFTGTIMWNSGKTGMTTTSDGNRSPNINYSGSSLSWGETYFWKIKFWDTFGVEGSYSSAAQFGLNSIPGVPYLDFPENNATGETLTPDLKTTATDADSDYLRYKIEMCTNPEMNQNCQTFDQTSSQTGWSGQNTQSNTAYTSGTQATFTLQSPLIPGTTYYWKSYAVDPAGTISWSNSQDISYNFTTVSGPAAPSGCMVQKIPDENRFLITWTDNANNEDGYEIQKSINGGDFSLLQTDLAADTEYYEDSDVSEGYVYRYRVASYFSSGPSYSSWCSTSTISLESGIFSIKGIDFKGIILQ